MKVAAILLVLCVLIALAMHLAWHDLPELEAMTDEQLEQESWWEAQSGSYRNKYSRELGRRAKQRQGAQ